MDFSKYSFSTDKDRKTAKRAVDDLLQLQRTCDGDEAARHTDTYKFLLDESGHPQL